MVTALLSHGGPSSYPCQAEVASTASKQQSASGCMRLPTADRVIAREETVYSTRASAELKLPDPYSGSAATLRVEFGRALDAAPVLSSQGTQPGVSARRSPMSDRVGSAVRFSQEEITDEVSALSGPCSDFPCESVHASSACLSTPGHACIMGAREATHGYGATWVGGAGRRQKRRWLRRTPPHRSLS